MPKAGSTPAILTAMCLHGQPCLRAEVARDFFRYSLAFEKIHVKILAGGRTEEPPEHTIQS